MVGPSFPQFLTPSDIAEIFCVAKPTVYTWAARGCLPHIRIGGSLRFDPHAITEFIQRQAEPASPLTVET
jgi:excisionase family DNA binding protein